MHVSFFDRYLLVFPFSFRRCLGEEFLPHLHSTVTRIFEALSVNAIATEQDLTGRQRHGQHGDDDEDEIGDDDEEDDDEQDEDDGLQMMETLEGQWVTVRTALIEEQSQALQMLSLLLHNPFLTDSSQEEQEYLPQQIATHKARIAAFYPYVQQTAQFLQQALLKSPHEDIRAETLSLLPKVIAVCDAADQVQAKQELLFFCLGLLLPYLEKETNVELLMTGLVTLRTLLLSCGQNNNNKSSGLLANVHTTIWLSDVQMQAVVTAVKMIMRDSLQRRAMLRAELQVIETLSFCG